MRHRPFNIAHQGASRARPPNTLAAFRRAIEMRADWIELDVVASADSAVIVSHDTTVDRCTDGAGRIADLSLAELKRLDAGIRFGAPFAGERLPTLEETIDIVARSPLRLCVEIKGDSPDEHRHTAALAAAVLRRRDCLRWTVVTSFDPGCLAEIRRLEPRLATALDPEPQDGTRAPWELCRQVLECGATFMLHDHRALSRAIVDEARRHGFSVWAWTANDRADMQRAVNTGADGLMTDCPDILDALLSGDELR
jgi:glycerophosphoryl diester phosphodiesterase